MKEKIKLGCGLGCGTVLIFFILGFIFLRLLVYAPPTVFIENKAIGYIIEHVDEFKDEINAMGYEVRVAYTVGERKKKYNPADQGLQKKMGYRERGILILERENEEYVFDVGFDVYRLCMDDGTIITMSKDYYYEDKVLDLEGKIHGFPIYVTVSDDALKARLGGAIRNNYTADFMKAKSIGMHGAEMRFDAWIKERISAEELRAIYERCIGLQEKLVELYKARKG